MATRRIWLIIGLVGVILLALVFNVIRQQVMAQPVFDGSNVILEQDYRLTEAVADDLVVLGDGIALGAGSRVDGDAALIGGTITVDGFVDGELTLIGERLTIGAGARIAGDAALMGDQVTIAGAVDGLLHVTGASLIIEPGAQIAGGFTVCVDDGGITDGRVGAPPFRPCMLSEQFAGFAALTELRDRALRGEFAPVNALGMAVGAFGAAAAGLVLIGFSALGVTVFPMQISRIEEAMRTQTRTVFGLGVAAVLLLVGLTALQIVLLGTVAPLGLLLLPVYVIAGLVYLVLLMFGLVTLALVVGDWLLRRMTKQPAPPVVAAALGSLMLALILVVVSFLPYGLIIELGVLAAFSAIASGAVLYTRLGMRSARRTYFVQG
jgi:cytoskeletal protein CcmA (bactofilin family)